MAERIAYLEAVVGADITAFRKGMRDVRNETGILSEQLAGVAGVGRSLTLSLTAPLVAMGTYFGQAASEFDAAMRNINSIAFLSDGALAGLSERVLQFGASIRGGPTAAAETLYTVFSAGLTNIDQAFSAMEIGTRTAEAGLANVITTTEGLVAAALTFGDTSESAFLRFSDATTLAVQLGVGSMDVFNTGMSNVIGTGAVVGATFEDMAATLAFLSQRGLSFASAGTYLNNAMSKLIRPGTELQAIFQQIGVESGTELLDTFGGIEGALRRIYQEVGSNEQAWASFFPDVRGFKAVSRLFTLFEEDGTDAVSEFFDTFEGKMANGGITMAAWEEQMKSFAATFDLFKSAGKAVAIVLGQQLLPIITPFLQKITSLMVSFTELNPEVHRFVVIIGMIAAAIGPVLWLAGSFLSTLTPLGILFKVLVAGGAAFATSFNDLSSSIGASATGIQGALNPLITAVGNFFDILNLDGSSSQPTIEPIVVETSDWLQVETPKSLWDIYQEMGYDDAGIDWNDFVRRATAAGWDGQAITSEDVLNIDFDGIVNDLQINGERIATTAATTFSSDNLFGEMEGNTLGDRFRIAIATVWPIISRELGNLWTQFSAWADANAGAALDALAGVFSGSTDTNGQSPIYQAIRNLLDGDLTGAINAVVPGAGDRLQAAIGGDWGQAIQNAFPQISTALGTLFGNFRTWFETEGLPSISRGIGFVIGRIPVLIGQALGALGDLIKGNDWNDTAGAFGDQVGSPLMEGFQDAFADVEMGTNPFETTVNGIVTMFTTAVVAAFALGLVLPAGFGSAVMTSLGAGLLRAPISGAMWALGFLASKIMAGLSVAVGAASAAAAPVVAAIGTALTGATAAISTAAAGIGTALMGALTFAGTAASTAAASLVTGIGAALALLAPVLAFGAITLSIASIAAVVISPEARQVVMDAGRSLIDGMFGEGAHENLNRSVENAAYRVAAGLAEASGNTDLAMRFRSMIVGTDEVELTNVQQQIVDSFGDTPTATLDTLTLQATNLIYDLSSGANMGPADASRDAALSDWLPKIEVPAEDIITFTNPEGLQTQVTTLVEGLATQAAAASAPGSAGDATIAAQNFTQPFTTAFNDTFGPAGTVTTTWSTFVTDYGTDMAALVTSSLQLETSILPKFNTFAVNLTTAKDSIVLVLGQIKTAVDEMVLAFGNIPTTITVPTVSGGTPDGSHAGGLNRVPYDGYMAQLHRGERVLTRAEASAADRGLPLGNMRSSGTTNTSYTTNAVTINGVTDTDRLIRDLRRKGIDLDDRR